VGLHLYEMLVVRVLEKDLGALHIARIGSNRYEQRLFAVEYYDIELHTKLLHLETDRARAKNIGSARRLGAAEFRMRSTRSGMTMVGGAESENCLTGSIHLY